MYRHCKCIISLDLLEKVLGAEFTNFINKYINDLNILSRFYENNYIETGYDLEGVEDDENIEEVEKYYNDFLISFDHLKEKFKKITGGILELGYAEDIDNLINGFYFYIKNAYIENPEIKKEIIENVKLTAIIEDFNKI